MQLVSVGIVFKARDKFAHIDYAIKFMSLSDTGLAKDDLESSITEAKEEIMKMASLQHENIIKYVYSLFFQKDSVLSIVMELAETSLAAIMSTLSYEQAYDYTQQICQGISYLHLRNGLIHRDLKPENLLILKGKVKICDFGIAKLKVSEKTTCHELWELHNICRQRF